MFKQRWLFLYGFLICTGLMARALYMEHVLGLEPCPLCAFQRLFVIAIGAVLLAGALHGPGVLGGRVYGGLTALLALAGAGVAGRHVWLQNLPPDKVPDCGPGLEYMFQVFPFAEALRMVFEGSGECAEVQWTFLGLSIPGWTLVMFTGFALFGLSQLVLGRRQTPGAA